MIINECQEMKRIKKHDLVPTVIDHIFSICKEDKNFKMKGNIEKIDRGLIIIEKKLDKQKSLIQQSDKIKSELKEKIKNIDDESFKVKCQILETLGSE